MTPRARRERAGMAGILLAGLTPALAAAQTTDGRKISSGAITPCNMSRNRNFPGTVFARRAPVCTSRTLIWWLEHGP